MILSWRSTAIWSKYIKSNSLLSNRLIHFFSLNLGTLETLSDPEKNILENIYDVRYKTFMPSVYGRNNLKFEPKDDVLVETEENHYKMIAQTTRQRIVGKNEGTMRAVFVVFENKQELYKFYNSDAFMPYKLDAAILTEGAFN